jgi:ribosomal protein S18 acetylase RimI-like enzyme
MDLTFRQSTEADFDFARKAHRQAYHDVVVRQFGSWDEALQEEFFKSAWAKTKFEIILCDGVPAGYRDITTKEGKLHIVELVILPEYQGRGIGASIIKEVQDKAAREKTSVRLEALQMNRALNLYRRLGFKDYAKNETHSLLEWRP